MIITRTPMRIPLGGGGTDLPSYYQRYGGLLVSAAIKTYVYITLNRRFEDNIRISYSRTEIADTVDAIEHPIVREALRLLELGPGLEIVSIADAPANTGLGSSASFTVGLLLALHAHKREHPSPQQLAEEAFEIEAIRLHEPVGKQDQYIAAYGGVTSLEIACNGCVTARPLAVSAESIHQFEHEVMFFYTGIQRRAGDVLMQQSQALSGGNCDVATAMHEIKAIGYEVAAALQKGDLQRFGELLDAHWQVKKRTAGNMTSRTIDAWYDIARRHGATGGKVMGAGGGGFLMLYAPSGDKTRLRSVLSTAGLREVRFAIEPEGAKVMLNI